MRNIELSPEIVPTSRLELYDVVNLRGEDMGQVQNFMIDMVTGRVALVIVAFGGMLGISDHWIAIPFERMVWKPAEKKFVLNLPRTALEDAPGIDKDRWPAGVNAEWLSGVYARYGCSPYWEKRLGETFHTGERAQQSGVYEYITHLDGNSCALDCQPSPAEVEIPLAVGETFPPVRSCGKPAVWRLVRLA